MKKTLSIALAATIAATAVGLSAAPAAARDRHYHRNDRAAIAIFGAIAGIAAIAAANQRRYELLLRLSAAPAALLRQRLLPHLSRLQPAC